MPQPYKCTKCSRATFTLIKLIQHVDLVHAHEPNFTITCGLNNCKSTFKVYESFRRHVYRKHSEHVKPNNQTNGIENVDTGGDDEHPEEDKPPCMDTLLINFKENLCNFVLKCREKNHIPQSVQQEIINDMNFLFCYFKENYDSFITYHLQQNGFNVLECPELQEILKSNDFFVKATEAIRSPYMLKEHCKSKLSLVEPVQQILRSEMGQEIGTYSYVPIKDVLTNYFSIEDMDEDIEVTKHLERDPNYLSDYTDGTHFKTHPFFKDNPDALRLHFYEDEFEVVNPLGAKRGKHKLCAFYYTVGNINGKHRSKLNHIHLALLVRYTYVKTCGLQTILKPLINDLKKLETEGIKVKVNGTEKTIHAGLATFSADNLSAHMLARFTMSFNSHRICRFCMATYDEMKKSFHEEDFVLRRFETHEYHLKACCENAELKKAYGVTGPCPFSELKYFDTTTAFPPDIMHDILEGVVPVILKLVICQSHKEKLITIPEINSELQHLAIGQNDLKNKPVQLLERLLQNATMSGSAAQKWCLFRLLPFIMASHVPKDCSYWHVYLMCREIVDIVFASKLNRELLSYLKLLTVDFLNELKRLFGDVITPKFHYMIHYSRLIAMYGPLRALWCMRFEAKHQYFKLVANSSRNFINIAKTLSDRHQLRQCWEFSQNMIHEFEEVLGTNTNIIFSSLPCELQRCIASKARTHTITKQMVLQRVSGIDIDSVKYNCRDVFIVDYVHSENIPLFFFNQVHL